MDTNPIKYQDLILPDDSIEKLISQLEQLRSTYTGMANDIKSEAAGIAASMTKISGATEDGRKRIKQGKEDTDRLAKAYKQLDAALAENAKEIARLNAVKREANNYNKMIVQRGKEEIKTSKQIKEASYQQLTAQYSLNKAYINSLSATDRKIAKNREIIRSTKEIYEQMKKLQADTGKMQLNVGNYPQIGSMLGGVGNVALRFAGAASAGALLAKVVGDNVSLAREYEHTLSGLAAILGTTKDGVQELNEQAQDLGATTVFTAKEVVEMQTELAKLGYSVQQIQNMAPSVLNFAQATGSSLADAASLAGATLRMFEKDTTDTTEVVDKMVAATTKSALSFSYLQNAMSTVAPVANAFGFNIEEVLALLGQLANAGFDASSAATATRNILLNLADANGKLAKRLGEPVKNLDDLVKGLKELDAQGVDLNETLELTDKRSVAAFNTFIKGADAAKTLRDELANSNGAAKQMADTMSDNLEGSMKSLTSAWEGFNLHINESNGFLKTCVDWLKDVVVYFDKILTKEGRVKAALDKLQGGGDGKPTRTERMVSFLGDISDKGRREDTYNRQVSEFWRFINKRDAEIKKEENYLKQQRERTDLTAEGEQALNLSLERIQHRIDRLKTENEAAKKMLKQYQQGAEGILKADTETTTTTTTTKTTTGGKGGKVVKSDDIAKEAKKRAQEMLKIQQETENLRNAMIEDEYERELAIINTNYERQKVALEQKAADDKQLTEAVNAELVLLEQKKNADIEALTNKHLNKILDEDNKIKEAERRASEQSIRMQQQAIDMETEIRNLDIDMLETSEKEKTRLRLEAEKERLQKLLALYEADGKKLSDTEKQLIQKQIEGINHELSKNKSRDVYDALGFNLSDEQKDAIDTSVSFATDALNTFMQAYTEAADKKRELADREVERTQQVLQTELEARANGYANDVETARKEVEMAKKQQQQAIENQKKAQRTQIALDTAMQASNLITATTTILKLGFPWFIPALAVMWGTFAAAKVKAWQSVGDSEKYGDGTVELLQGGSHQSGNDIDLGRKPNGTRRRAEGGEFFAVINKRSSRKYRSVIPDVIHSLNNDTFADKYLNAYDGGNIIVQGADKAQDLTRLQDDVTAIRKQGESSYSADGRVRRYKNLVQIIN